MAKRNRITKQCEECGADVTRVPSQFREHTFCSPSCRGKANRGKTGGKRVAGSTATKPCEVCGNSVTRKASAFKEHVFCSRGCYLSSDYLRGTVEASNARRFAGKRESKPCTHCGKMVERASSQFSGKRIYCSRECQGDAAIQRGHRQVRDSGYAVVFVGPDYPGASKSGHILEHRKVMQDMLGRPLVEGENVHHRNGVRDDNRRSNLELWSESQPSGQRVVDKIVWARSILALYEGVDPRVL